MVDETLHYGSLKPKGYRPRIVDARIRRMLSLFGAVEIRGTKWCGKTWSALAAGGSVIHVDLPAVRPLVAADPLLALEGARPHVVDEWQEVPDIWDVVRHAVDEEAAGSGLYILTGSSAPEKDKVRHSGAGRIARVDMGTLTLWERGKSSGAVSDDAVYEMALGLINTGKCDLAIATTGIAGPKSDGTQKPVGLCYIGIGMRERIFVYKFQLAGDRRTVTETAINHALFLAYKQIK